MKKFAVFTALVFLSGIILAYFLAGSLADREVTGTVLALEKEKVTLTGEKVTIFTLAGDPHGRDYLLGAPGHDLGIAIGDRLAVIYSRSDVIAHKTDSFGNRLNYWKVKSFQKLPQ